MAFNRRSRDEAKRADLLRWHERLLAILAGRILSINVRVAEEWARMQAEVDAKNRALPVVDGLLAATARRYQLTLVTDNVRDFAVTGARLLDPFD